MEYISLTSLSFRTLWQVMILIAMMRTHFPAMTLPMRTSMEPGVRARWLATEMEDVELGWLMVPKLEVSEPLVSCSCDHRRPALDQNIFSLLYQSWGLIYSCCFGIPISVSQNLALNFGSNCTSCQSYWSRLPRQHILTHFEV